MDRKEASIRWLFDNSRELMAVIGADNTFKVVNPAWTKATGWAEGELVGMVVIDIIHPSDIETVVHTATELRAGRDAEYKARLRHKDGAYRWYSAYHKILENGSLIAVLNDVTEERAKTEELEESRLNSRLLAEAAGIGTWSFDPDRGRHLWSPDFCALSGWSQEELETPAQFNPKVHPDDLDAMMRITGKGIKGGVPGFFQHRMLTKDGRWVHIRATFRAIRQPSGLHMLKGISQDVTPLVEALEAAEAASEAKASFLANMSHEIRTPLNGVMGVLQLIGNEPLTYEGRKMLREAVGCGEMLAALLNDVLDFSKIEAGKLELKAEPVNPGHLVEGVASLIRGQAEAKGLKLTVERADAKGWVAIDPVRVRQALFNLVGNAVKFALSGEVGIRARLHEMDGCQRLRIEVHDTGVGISKDAQASLFQRFSQADGSTTRRFGGTGLGLAITQRLAEMMGGEVGVESVLGQGSCFWIDIAAPPAEAVRAEVVAESGYLDGLSILVVEDNAMNRMIAGKMLENLGATVSTAEDGERGVEAAANGNFDLILMDIQMPGIDGVEATRRIRLLEGPAKDLPIIALTANVMAHQRQDYLAAGMNGVVGKPINPNALRSEIARLAGGGGTTSAEVAA